MPRLVNKYHTCFIFICSVAGISIGFLFASFKLRGKFIDFFWRISFSVFFLRSILRFRWGPLLYFSLVNEQERNARFLSETGMRTRIGDYFILCVLVFERVLFIFFFVLSSFSMSCAYLSFCSTSKFTGTHLHIYIFLDIFLWVGFRYCSK